MPSANGHKKTALLYCRVSTAEQVEKGYSLAQQLEALREHANREGYEILEEVTDPGQSGASLVRPGLDRARDLVAEGGVSVVLAQDADRITRDPAHRAFLDEEFDHLGTRLVALDDWGDDTHEGELLKYLKGWVSKGERLKTTERTRRGKLQKVRQGKIIATMKPRYGFRYNEARNGLVVYEPEMAVVERIFRLAAEGFGTKAIQSRLYHEGIPSPKGGEIWSRPIIKRMVLNDIYKRHTYGETVQLVSAEVAATLNPTQEYGIWWWNRSAKKTRQVSEPDGNGHRQYRKRVVTTPRDKQEWLAVPAPAYLPRALVDQARALIATHRPPQRKRLARTWELRGLLRCSCGWKMSTHTTKPKNKDVHYYYYTCESRNWLRSAATCTQKTLNAHKVETAVWEFVSGVMKNPERIRVGMNALIEQRRHGMHGDPEREAKAWLEKITEVDGKRARYQDMAAEGLITFDELRAKLEGLAETRETAERELEALRDRQEEAEQLERDRDALLASWTDAAPEDLDALTSEQRNELYHRLHLEITPREDGYEVKGPFCTSEPLST